jgi:4-hydroxythreonine-4-phosphate dehydrogenase
MPTSRSGRKARTDRIRLALTIGDTAGIGPEVLVKALARWPKKNSAHTLVFADAFLLNALARRHRLPLRFTDIASLDGWEKTSDSIPCFFEGAPRSPAAVAVRSIELAACAALAGRVEGIVTPPIHKAALKRAGFKIPGHTEFLAKLSGTKRFEMMLVGGPLRVVLVTRHESIRRVPALVTRKRVEETLVTTVEELKRSFGIQRPRVAVCGLNPHAGEEGTIGKEELAVIAPAVADARRRTGEQIAGPLSPDALFVDAYRGLYDAEVCMYHDQGLIPLKMISRGHGVNVTLGLPFVRTSPDHGTAYDIAGRGTADAGSMIEALEMAFELARRRRGR